MRLFGESRIYLEPFYDNMKTTLNVGVELAEPFTMRNRVTLTA